MAQVTMQGTGYGRHGTFIFTEEEMRAAWLVADPDEQLFYDFYGPKFETLEPSGKFDVLRRVAELVERAASLGLVADSPEAK